MMLAKAWREHVRMTGWVGEDLPQRTNKVFARIWSQVLEDDEPRNVFIKNCHVEEQSI